MRMIAHAIRVDGRHEPLLPPTSVTAEAGQLTYVATDQDRSTALGLALTGRIHLDAGQIELLSDQDGSLADLSALVDAPEVSEPLPNLRVRDAAAEALAIARRRSSTAAVAKWLAQHGLDRLSDRTVETLDGPERIAVLCALAIAHRHIQLLVIDTPDRHRGELRQWQRIAEHYAQNGYAVIVLCDQRSIDLLGVPGFRIGETPPLPPLIEPDEPAEPDGPSQPDGPSDLSESQTNHGAQK